MKQNQLRFRNTYGEVWKEQFEQILPSKTNSEATSIKGNNKYIAMSWQSAGGGSLSIFENNSFRKVDPKHPKIIGHNGPVLDFNFYPFDENIIATGSEDSMLRLWRIPEDFLNKEENMEKPLVELSGHSRKIVYTEWNPTSESIIATGSFDNTVKVWNMERKEQAFSMTAPDCNLGIDWNRNGSLIASIWKDKYYRIIDPRQSTFAIQGLCHEGPQSQKIAYLDSNYVVSLGKSKNIQREMALWDLRSPEKRVQNTLIDTGSGTLYPHFDYDLKMLYVWGQGNSNIRYYSFDDGQLLHLNTFSSKDPQKQLGFYPKSTLNTKKCEIMRAIKLQDKSISIISFIQPRAKNDTFQEDLYPECLSQIPSQSVDDWMNGKTAEPTLMSLRPGEPQQQQTQKFNAFQVEKKEIKKQDNPNNEELDSLIIKVEENKILQQQLQETIDQQILKIKELELNQELLLKENQELKNQQK